MGRGLSNLQRFIMAKAAEHKRLYYAEILAGYYGWEPARPIRRHELDAEDALAALADAGLNKII